MANKGVWGITMRAPDKPMIGLKSFGLAMKRMAQQEGAKCVPIWKEKELLLAIQGMSRERVQELMVPFLEWVEKQGLKLDVIERADNSVEGELPDAFTGPGALLHEKLTKKFLFSLPAGAYVVSTSYSHETGMSDFRECLGDLGEREAVWKRAIEAGAAQRKCLVVWTYEEFLHASWTGFGPPF